MNPRLRGLVDDLLREILDLEARIIKPDWPADLSAAITELERELRKVDLEAVLQEAK